MYIYIRSMSEYQSEIYRSITNNVPELDKHIMKLMLFPDYEGCDHWISEVYSLVNSVKKLKGKNKFPSAKFIKKALSVCNDMLDALLEQVKDEESELSTEYVPFKSIVSGIEMYQDWLASQLSSRGVVTKSNVKAELTAIMRAVR